MPGLLGCGAAGRRGRCQARPEAEAVVWCGTDYPSSAGKLATPQGSFQRGVRIFLPPASFRRGGACQRVSSFHPPELPGCLPGRSGQVTSGERGYSYRRLPKPIKARWWGVVSPPSLPPPGGGGARETRPRYRLILKNHNYKRRNSKFFSRPCRVWRRGFPPRSLSTRFLPFPPHEVV